MTDLILYLGHGLLVIGLFFVVTAVIGLKRLPDVMSKMHATGVSDSLGLPLCYIGVALISLGQGMSIKYFLLAIFALIVSPVVTHSFAKYIFNKKDK
jgi:multicomponent Na+:H+ antiporter subunit G